MSFCKYCGQTCEKNHPECVKKARIEGARKGARVSANNRLIILLKVLEGRK